MHFVTQRFEVGSTWDWDNQVLDTNQQLQPGGAWFADEHFRMPTEGYRFFGVTHADMRGYHDYSADYSASGGDYQLGVWTPTDRHPTPGWFTARFTYPTVSVSIGCRKGWFEATFVKD